MRFNGVNRNERWPTSGPSAKPSKSTWSTTIRRSAWLRAPFSSLRQYLEPDYIKKLPTLDGWNNDIQYVWGGASNKDVYTVASYGKDGAADAGLTGCDNTDCTASGDCSKFDDDIIFSNGQFSCKPAGKQK